MDDIGEIKLAFRRVRRGDLKSKLSDRVFESAPESLSEKQVKGRAISHGTS